MKMPAIKKVLASKNERIFPAETDRFALSPHEEQDEFVEDDAEGEMKRNQEESC